MNRLVILGNGFDLAHGLPTSYQDFVLGYFINAFDIGFNEDTYEDNIISVTKRYPSERIPKLKSKNIEELIEELTRVIEVVELNFKNEFFKLLIQKLKIEKWVDFENAYYSRLNEILFKTTDPLKSKVGQSKILNDDFEQIKKELEKYLTRIEHSLYQNTSIGFTEIFHQQFQPDDFTGANYTTSELKDIVQSDPQQVCHLNFNYTSILDWYLKPFPGKHQIINIHGQLNEEKNPIVFGYGDELDSNYKAIENFNENELFKHIKSFSYFKTTNYFDLIRFIESEPFQIFIVGHSCGLSDRTLLNFVFESKNCKSIKIFYYENETNYITTTQEISRHFSNKALMRKRIVPFSVSQPCPQIRD